MTINIDELRRLAQAATPGPDGVSLSWIRLLRDFQQGASPAAISELIDRLEAAEKERDALRAKIEEMEKQEPVGKIVAFGESLHEPSWRGGRLPPLMTELYALPGAKGEEK